ncbi:lactonase family protein [Vreelandella populi]|uniref:Lactonase family protein n=2 Tax=Vreelandella populi TaxID=2498858 RepID=A0A3S0WNJ5_9GAMM|nr:lactonase family protein [Halomonas populi]RUR46386.1 lactonase family protein [Halomonas populi]
MNALKRINSIDMQYINMNLSYIAVTKTANSGAQMSDKKQTLYVGCALSGELYTINLSVATGELGYCAHEQLPGLQKPGGAMPLTISRDRNTLYAVSRGEPFFIAAYNIGTQGRLQHIGNTPIETNLAYIQTSIDDSYLLSASFIDHHVSTYPVQEDHRISESAKHICDISNAHMLSMSPDSTTVLATGLGKDVIYQWQWLTSQANEKAPPPLQSINQLQLPEGTGPRHIAYHPVHPIAYIIGERNGTINAVRYNASGLTLVQTDYLPDQVDAFQAADIHITPDGRFLYASEKATSTLHLFKVRSDGIIRFEKLFSTENRPRGFAITPDGNYLVAAGQFSHHISSYRIDAETGYLQFISRLAVGQSPDWVEML